MYLRQFCVSFTFLRNKHYNRGQRSLHVDEGQTKNPDVFHTPVMANEVLQYLALKPGQIILDMTFGAGGHSMRLLNSVPGLKIIALDRDPGCQKHMLELQTKYPDQVIPLLGKFSELPDLLNKLKIKQNTLDAVLIDCGCSSMQFDTPTRGFSLSRDGPLDMRMDGCRIPTQYTAADVLAHASEEHLMKILRLYGEEKHYKKIARAIFEARFTFSNLQTTYQLKDLVESICEKEVRSDYLGRQSHVATKTFQALRIFVNNELNELNYGMILAQKYLKAGGVLVALSFHSLEDRIVKRHLVGNVVENAVSPLPLHYASYALSYGKHEMDSFLEHNWEVLTKHVVTPTIEEIQSNPRCRSAKLRASLKLK